ncbi:MAG: maleylpyruvate isomerase N-terminal domain-containing protein [Micromonosporaceae bacterium]
MTPIAQAYLAAARSAAQLLAAPAVAAGWAEPSALAGFTVGGLAGHLASQILFVPRTLDAPPPDGEPVPLLGHYERVTWIGADLDAEVNARIRAGGDEEAAGGPIELARRTAAAVDTLRAVLAGQPDDRVVAPPAGPWALRLDDFLITRMMEITVHSDDLAGSVGLATPELPAAVLDPVLALLTALAVRRHGAPAVVRALSRAERAPQTIAAF